MPDKFNGEGFSRDPIEGEEAARHREMFHAFQARWPLIKDTFALMAGVKIAASLVKWGGPLGAAAFATVAFARAKGWL